MGSEANEELFIVSALGVVDADETVLVASEMDVQPRCTMPWTGPCSALKWTVRCCASPGLGASAATSLAKWNMMFDAAGPLFSILGMTWTASLT